jgi:hypothetical protein
LYVLTISERGPYYIYHQNGTIYKIIPNVDDANHIDDQASIITTITINVDDVYREYDFCGKKIKEVIGTVTLE